jgi:predicted metalloprotease with PDZ domain
VVHSNPADYDSAALQDMVKRVTHATVDWMQDRPYDQYTFLYDFPRGPGSGGMEHAYGTAISSGAASGPIDISRLSDVSTHEFFHLWNVKRIRPQSLEPIDYQHEQDTRALWFSEGVTNTVSELMRVRAGVMDEGQYLKNLAAAIVDLNDRPAYLWQSAEDSSLDAWFEGNAFYRTPERSVSYYEKGEILGVLLDLRIRELTDGHKSLRDLFQWMNEHYAKQHRFFADSAGVEEAAETITDQSFADFFRDYVAGVKPLPYDDAFRFVGLQLTTENITVADFGFTSTENLDGQSEVTAVTSGSDAERAGLKPGDRILLVNGTPAAFRLDRELAHQLPNQTIKLRIARAGKEHTVKIKSSPRQEQQLVLTDVAGVTSDQRAHRTAWTHGNDQSGGTP